MIIKDPFSVLLRSNEECAYVTLRHFRTDVTLLATAIIVVIIAAVITIILSSARAYRRRYPRLMKQGCMADSRAQWWWGCCFFSRDTESLSHLMLERRRTILQGQERRNDGRQKGESEATERERERERSKRRGQRGKGVPTHCGRHYANLRARMYAR